LGMSGHCGHVSLLVVLSHMLDRHLEGRRLRPSAPVHMHRGGKVPLEKTYSSDHVYYRGCQEKDANASLLALPRPLPSEFFVTTNTHVYGTCKKHVKINIPQNLAGMKHL